MKKIIALVIFCLISGSWLAFAEDQDAAASIAEKNYQGIPYLNGGVGEEERVQMRERDKDFNLKLVFAEKTGPYLTSVEVVVVSANGQPVLKVDSAGPILMARLPAGNYTAKASFGGQAQQKSVAISAGNRAELSFLW